MVFAEDGESEAVDYILTTGSMVAGVFRVPEMQVYIFDFTLGHMATIVWISFL